MAIHQSIAREEEAARLADEQAQMQRIAEMNELAGLGLGGTSQIPQQFLDQAASANDFSRSGGLSGISPEMLAYQQEMANRAAIEAGVPQGYNDVPGLPQVQQTPLPNQMAEAVMQRMAQDEALRAQQAQQSGLGLRR